MRSPTFKILHTSHLQKERDKIPKGTGTGLYQHSDNRQVIFGTRELSDDIGIKFVGRN